MNASLSRSCAATSRKRRRMVLATAAVVLGAVVTVSTRQERQLQSELSTIETTGAAFGDSSFHQVGAKTGGMMKPNKGHKRRKKKKEPPVIPDTVSTDKDGICTPAVPEGCDPLSLEFGRPVVLISLGRSGSEITWQLMSKLAYMEQHSSDQVEEASFTKAGEDMGWGAKKLMTVFGQLRDQEHGSCWLKRILCDKQAANRKEFPAGQLSTFIGTKWKPYPPSWNLPKARQALEWVTKHSDRIKVIHNVRNPIDVSISAWRYDQLRNHKRVDSHCTADDTRCIQQHAKMIQTMSMPVKDFFYYINMTASIDAGVQRQLAELNVPYHAVYFEQLYYGDSYANGNFSNTGDDDSLTTGWMQLFEYLGVGPTANLTLGMVRRQMEYVATSHRDRSQNVPNFAKLQAVLVGTPWERFLYY